MLLPIFIWWAPCLDYSRRPHPQKLSLYSNPTAPVLLLFHQKRRGRSDFLERPLLPFLFFVSSHFTRLSDENRPGHSNPGSGPSHHKIPRNLDRRSRGRSNRTDSTADRGRLQLRGVGPYALVCHRQSPAA